MPKLTLPEAQEIYANRAQFLKIEDYTDEELEATMQVLSKRLPLIYEYLNFIDCYFERRRRKSK